MWLDIAIRRATLGAGGLQGRARTQDGDRQGPVTGSIIEQAAKIDIKPLVEQQVAGFAGPIRRVLADLGAARPGSPQGAATDTFFVESAENLINGLMYAAHVRSEEPSLTLSEFVFRAANDFDGLLADAYELRDVPPALAKFLDAPRQSTMMVRGGIERAARQILMDGLMRMGLPLHGQA